MIVEPLNIAIFSPSGQAGRTFLAHSVFDFLHKETKASVNLACFDIFKTEIPDGYSANIAENEDVMAEFPYINQSKCRYCGLCATKCAAKALIFNKYIPSVTVIKGLCIACSLCVTECSKQGISIRRIKAGELKILKTPEGEIIWCNPIAEDVSEIPFVKAIVKHLKVNGTTICDFAPGWEIVHQTVVSVVNVAWLMFCKSGDWENEVSGIVKQLNDAGIPFITLVDNFLNDEKFMIEITEYCVANYIPLPRQISVLSGNSKALFSDVSDLLSETYTKVNRI